MVDILQSLRQRKHFKLKRKEKGRKEGREVGEGGRNLDWHGSSPATIEDRR